MVTVSLFYLYDLIPSPRFDSSTMCYVLKFSEKCVMSDKVKRLRYVAQQGSETVNRTVFLCMLSGVYLTRNLSPED